MSRANDPGSILRPIAEAPLQAYLSPEMQVADILDWILEQTGKAHVRMTSFSIAEEFIRRLWHTRRSGKVSGITLILDRKATQKTISLWGFISEVIDEVHLADNHSKILLVTPHDTSKQTVALVTSQNLTRGNRSESAVLTTDPAVTAALSQDFDRLLTYHSVPLNDIFRLSDNPG